MSTLVARHFRSDFCDCLMACYRKCLLTMIDSVSLLHYNCWVCRFKSVEELRLLIERDLNEYLIAEFSKTTASLS